MAQMVGKYQHERNENLDEYFQAVGVPYIPRKMMTATSPQMEISVDESQQWTISISSLLRTTVMKFKLGEEYEEHMPGGVVIKSTTVTEDNKLNTTSIGPDGGKVLRTYEFNDAQCILTLKHEKSGVEAKRYFRRFAS
ncbi:hypothetical protein ILUMI_12074 [Ignelater luminosus]|uniref:Lipocalin/cytosolic fatty-acid binding domain-containing protein n=1 Tax=Ignelater luminosus TaxID=2038154 RepID=A0A8K0CV03_IGNLU|nr:hypothetical protein ILUMI_12074 [Ignelater luminosus]